MNLFDRVPQGLFGALTGRNNRRTWDLLVRLSDRYFGPDSVPPYPDGYLHDQVVKEIERFLLDAGWEDEGDEPTPAVATPLSIQANQLLARLVDTGWLMEEKVGLRRFVSMRPVVARFFDTVQQFVTEGPQLFGGNVLLVYNQLKSVSQDPKGQAGGFISAAQLCVRLINSLNATTLRVRDLMKELTQEAETPVFVRRFFSEHISELYVRDFKQLRTENHPLRLRYEIIEAEDCGLPVEGRLLSPAPLIGDNRLRLPVEAPLAPKRTALRKREMTPHEKALHALRKAMIEHRDTTPAAVRRYVREFLSQEIGRAS